MTDNPAMSLTFRRVFDEHYDAVSRYCHRRLDAADANDAAAEVFVVAWRKIDQMPTGEQTLPWLYGVARNEVSTARRARRRLIALRTKLSGQAVHHEPGPESVVVRTAEQAMLLEALAKLLPDDQEVLRLRAYEGLTVAETAVALGCSVEAAKKRSSRAIKRLRSAAGIPGSQDAVLGSRAIQEGGER